MHSFHKAKPSKTSSVHLTNFNGIARPLKMHILHAGVIVNTPSRLLWINGVQGAESIHAKFNSIPIFRDQGPCSKDEKHIARLLSVHITSYDACIATP